MSANPNQLEVLTPSIKFASDRQTRINTLAAQARAATELFLDKRERLDSSDFSECTIRRARGISDVLAPDYKLLLDGPYDRKRRRSSVLMMKELPQMLEGDIHATEHEETEHDEITAADEKAESKRRKDADGFDLGVPKSKRKKDGKFVIKLDKENEDLKLEQKSKARRKKQATDDDDKQDIDSCIQADDAAPENEGELKPSGFVPEKLRLKTKIAKVCTYWSKKSLYIPNVFRLAKLIDDDAKNFCEFQDYSKKSVLVQGQGAEHKRASEMDEDGACDGEFEHDRPEFIQRRSFCMVLEHPEDMLEFLK